MRLITTSSLLALLWPALAVSDVQYEEQCLPLSGYLRQVVVDADLMVATGTSDRPSFMKGRAATGFCRQSLNQLTLTRGVCLVILHIFRGLP